MTGFSADWLALREPADHRARDPATLTRVVAHLARLALPEIVDLGCGSGSNLRALAPRLGARQRWRLVDNDAALLDAAREALIRWADAHRLDAGGGVTLEKDGKVSEDDHVRMSGEVQKATDQIVAEVDQALSAKEKEIMTV